MTRPSQKYRERFYVEMAAKNLAKKWNRIDDCEQPDFIVTQDGQQIGLEVIELFRGPQDENGSLIKRSESKTQKKLNALRKEYEKRPIFH